MSCESRPLRTISLCALPFVCALAGAPSAAFSQPPACQPIRGGETAAQLARRLTGDSRNVYQPWFQVMDTSSRIVPKSQYDRIRRGWRACIAKEATEQRVRPAIHPETIESTDLSAANPQRTVSQLGPAGAVALAPVGLADTIRLIADIDLTWVWMGAAMILPLFGWWLLDDYINRRNTVSIVMKHFAHRFVREFERPLIQQPEERPLRARLRIRPARARLEILLAPGQGRRYPNLSDHKKNMEYDVVRIHRLLADDSFVRDPLYTQAGWVVVPFRLEAGQKHRGVTCRSFF